MKGTLMSINAITTASTTSSAARAAGVPVLPSAPRRLARSRRLAGGSYGSLVGLTATVSSCPLR